MPLDKEAEFHLGDKPTVFYFNVEEFKMIKLETWQENGEDESDQSFVENAQLDIYITVDDKRVGPENYHWKSQYGFYQVDVDPNTD